MEFITGKHIDRRTFLRGMGATVALPFLDAMVPSHRAWADVVRGTNMDKTRLGASEWCTAPPGATSWAPR